MREEEILKTYKVPMARLMGFCKQEWWLIPPGVLFALASGATMPLMASEIMIKAMWAFYHPQNEMYKASLGQGPHAGDLAAAEQHGKDMMKADVEWASYAFLIVGFVRIVAQTAQMGLFGIVGESLTLRVRNGLLTAIMRQNIGFHDSPDHTPGQLTKALQMCAFRVSNLCVSMGDKADAFGALATGIFVGFFRDWRMTLGVIGSVPILGVIQVLEMQTQMGTQKEENSNLKTAAQIITDALTNARTVQACGSEKTIVQFYTDTIAPASKGDLKKNLISGIAQGMSQAMILWIMAGMFVLFAWLVDEGFSNFENGMKAMMAVMYAGSMAGMAFAITGDLGKATVAAHDMFKLLDTKSLIDGLDPTGEWPSKIDEIGRLQFVNVEFRYPFRQEVQVLKGVSFTVEAGQSVGLVGPSGSGKSTVMALLQRFYDPSAGSIMIGDGLGHDLSKLNIRWWRRQVGVVGQEPILFDDSVLNNVKYGFEVTEDISDEWLAKCKQMAHLSFIDSQKAQGWDTMVGPRGSRLSGGQKQRVAICRALLRNPAVLLLDEATSALDSESEKIVSAALESARKGRTSVAIAHRLSTIQNCDMILVVADGKLVEQGDHNSLIAKQGVYYKLSQQH
jgi:ABC-type multidrug transport system fused ATPase/permease subunit